MPNSKLTARGVNARVQIVDTNDYKVQQRVHRRPRETFNLQSRPFEIVPFLVHPVLPGETLDSAFFQSTAVSDPVANRLIGWWKEYHMFYVPIRALTEGDDSPIDPTDMNSLFLDPSFSMLTSYQRAANVDHLYTFKGAVDWVSMLYSYIVRRWFRDDGETWNASFWDNYYIAQIDQKNLFNSLKEETAGPADENELPGVDEIEELDILPGFTTIHAQWEMMRDQGMTDLSYRDYLKSYGVSPPKELETDEEVGEPTIEAERLRSVVKWTKPTLAPQVGSASISPVMYWSLGERITKRRFFGEPGFIFGVTVCRPKIYLGNQKGHFVGLLKNAYTWLPAVLQHLPYTSVVEQLDSATDGILQGGDDDYFLDIKDGFIHGGQFVNWTMNATNNNGLAMPEVSDLNKKYITEAMMNSLFSVTDGSKSFIYEDGSVHFDILGKLRETTPGTGIAT